MTAAPAVLALASPGAVTVVVTGEVVAKGRPRMTRRGIVYTPADTRRYENDVRYMARIAMAGRPPLEGAIRVHVTAVLPVPKSFSGRRARLALDGALWPAKRPDADNLIKTATDALNGIVYLDDAQICDLRGIKVYGGQPRLEVEVVPL